MSRRVPRVLMQAALVVLGLAIGYAGGRSTGSALEDAGGGGDASAVTETALNGPSGAAELGLEVYPGAVFSHGGTYRNVALGRSSSDVEVITTDDYGHVTRFYRKLYPKGEFTRRRHTPPGGRAFLLTVTDPGELRTIIAWESPGGGETTIRLVHYVDANTTMPD
jgi:hypothetical protein